MSVASFLSSSYFIVCESETASFPLNKFLFVRMGDHLPPSPNDWSSMVVIRQHVHDNTDCSVFPPNNHENLQIFQQHHHHHIPQSPPPSSSSSSSFSSYSFSSSDSDNWGLSSSLPFDSHVRKGGDFVGWMSIGLEILRSKLFAMVSSFRNRASDRGAKWSIGVPAAAVVMSCWIMMRVWCWLRKRRRRRRSLTRNETRLMNIIKDKDERITQLLHQIAQMNEILIARHKALAAKVLD